MTLNELAKRAKGKCDLLETWLNEYKCTSEKMHNKNSTITPSELVDLVCNSYKGAYTIYGFIWGAFAAGMFNDDELKDLLDELSKIGKKVQ